MFSRVRDFKFVMTPDGLKISKEVAAPGEVDIGKSASRVSVEFRPDHLVTATVELMTAETFDAIGKPIFQVNLPGHGMTTIAAVILPDGTVHQL